MCMMVPPNPNMARAMREATAAMASKQSQLAPRMPRVPKRKPTMREALYKLISFHRYGLTAAGLFILFAIWHMNGGL